MPNDAFDEWYDFEARNAMLNHTERQEIEEANLRASRSETAERWVLHARIASWLAETLSPPGATHLMLGSDGMRAAEELTSVAGPDTNIIVIEDNVTVIHDLVNDCSALKTEKPSHAIFLHLFDRVRSERGRIARTFEYRAPIIDRMRIRRESHRHKIPHMFIIGDTPSGEVTSAMLDDALVDSASYDGSTIGPQRLILDTEAGEALADIVHKGYTAQGPKSAMMRDQAHQAIGTWFFQRAATTAHAYLKQGAPFVVHGSTHIPEHIDNGAGLQQLVAHTLRGIRHLWEERRQIAIRLLDPSLRNDAFGHNMLYAIELVRSEPAQHDIDDACNEECHGK